MCLTGVDYFSTLGYQPGIAARPLERSRRSRPSSWCSSRSSRRCRCTAASPRRARTATAACRCWSDCCPTGRASCSCSRCIGFVATGFVITMTLSAADASAHMIENPFLHDALEGQQVIVTLVLLLLLGAVFLKGFKEAIGIAVVLVVVYHRPERGRHCRGPHRGDPAPEVFGNWTDAIAARARDPPRGHRRRAARIPGAGPRAVRFRDRRGRDAPGQGRRDRHPERPVGRIRNAKKLLTGAALIMSVMLLGSTLVTTLLIPAERVRGGRRGQRPGTGLPRPRAARRRLRHGLRRRHHRHPLVRRRQRDGRPAQHRAALPAPLRHGPGLGPADPAARGRLHASRGRRHRSSSEPTSTTRLAPTPPASSP